MKTASSSALALLLASFPALGQIAGGADCKHTQTYERLAWMSVSLMEGNYERRSATRAFEKLKPGINTITYSSITGPQTITGMRLRCHFELTGRDVLTHTIEVTVGWANPINIVAGVTFAPKMGLTLTETSPGLWKAHIGKAP